MVVYLFLETAILSDLSPHPQQPTTTTITATTTTTISNITSTITTTTTTKCITMSEYVDMVY